MSRQSQPKTELQALESAVRKVGIHNGKKSDRANWCRRFHVLVGGHEAFERLVSEAVLRNPDNIVQQVMEWTDDPMVARDMLQELRDEQCSTAAVHEKPGLSAEETLRSRAAYLAYYDRKWPDEVCTIMALDYDLEIRFEDIPELIAQFISDDARDAFLARIDTEKRSERLDAFMSGVESAKRKNGECVDTKLTNQRLTELADCKEPTRGMVRELVDAVRLERQRRFDLQIQLDKSLDTAAEQIRRSTEDVDLPPRTIILRAMESAGVLVSEEVHGPIAREFMDAGGGHGAIATLVIELRRRGGGPQDLVDWLSYPKKWQGVLDDVKTEAKRREKAAADKERRRKSLNRPAADSGVEPRVQHKPRKRSK